LVPNNSMHFFEHDHVILVARADASEECAVAFVG
jgi:hypothetical protein